MRYSCRGLITDEKTLKERMENYSLQKTAFDFGCPSLEAAILRGGKDILNLAEVR